jgi:hypothetical protein
MSHFESQTYDEREGLQVDSTGLEIGSPSNPRAEKISYTQRQEYNGLGGQKQVYVPRPTDGATTRQRRICGLRRTTFVLTVTIVCIVITAAVGGGVGGSMTANNSKAANK